MMARAPRLTHNAHDALKRIGNWTRFIGLIALACSLIGMAAAVILPRSLNNAQATGYLLLLFLFSFVGLLPAILLMRTSTKTERVAPGATAADLGHVFANLRTIFVVLAILTVVSEVVTIVIVVHAAEVVQQRGLAGLTTTATSERREFPSEASNVLTVAQTAAAFFVILGVIGAIRAATSS
ncbi:MAG TPA: hypothetical protein VMU84_02635 [Thermoanaerobaculia bacterium]|nr:hypothetical protein [Thermoanaerobaculia bacterium]